MDKIKLKVSPGYAFDWLAILEVKLLNGLISDEELKEADFGIQIQVGDQLFCQVLDDEVYDSLVNINAELFEKIDKVRSGDASITAAEIDNLNTQRFLLKNKIQEKFFGGGLAEKKNV